MNVIAVVVTYNRLELLKRNLSCLRRQTVPLTTLVVVDNGSTDGTGAWLDEQEDVKTIHQTNVGEPEVLYRNGVCSPCRCRLDLVHG